MRKLFALNYAGMWWVSSDRPSNFAPLTGEGRTLPAAYLDYMRKFEKVVARNKADKAEEQRCIDTIIAMQLKVTVQPPTNQEHVLVSDPPPIVIRPWWHRWFK